MTVKLLTEQRLEFLSLKGGCTGLSESTLIKMPHCWKSHGTAQMSMYMRNGTYLISALMMWYHRMLVGSCEQADHVRNCQRRILVSTRNCLLIWIIIIILQNIVIKGLPSFIVTRPSSVNNFFSNVFLATGRNVIKLQRKDLWMASFQNYSNSFILVAIANTLKNGWV